MISPPQLGMTPPSRSARRPIGDQADLVSMRCQEILSELSPNERLRELTAILANGIHRLRAIPPASPERREIPAESSQTGLEAVAGTRPDGVGRQQERTPEA